jgi:hypothetical protein
MKRSERDHAVYWPAFADLLTALVVVLVCTFAVIPGIRGPKPVPPDNEKRETGSKEGLPQSQSQYENEVLLAKRDLVLTELRKTFPNRVSRGDWIEIRLCTFTSDSVPDIELRRCRQDLRAVADTMINGTLLKALEEKHALVLPTAYLRARTGATSGGSSFLRAPFREAQDCFTSKGAAFSWRMSDPQYIERGNRKGGDIALVLFGRLRDADRKNIQEHWDAGNWDWLKQFKRETATAGKTR